MSAQTKSRRVTVPDVMARKGGEPLVVLTAYDAPTARILDEHCDILLVGDSAGMAVHGMSSTLGVTLEMMIVHGQAVMRGSEHALVVVDLPFGSYEESPQAAYRSAARVMAETGCQAVKIESGPYAVDTVRFLVDRGVPVMAHVGLLPQSVNVLGGFKAQGRDEAQRRRILDSAKAVAEAGAFSVVIEGVAEDLAGEISREISCPTIGIGASAACDGQVLVTPDMLGLFEWTPKFVKRFADLKTVIGDAAAAYAEEVKARRFPAAEHTYQLKKSS
jgi:3-methyl-2-oxobutanoate hydroxymethyltransferase